MSTIIMSACWDLQGMSPAQKAVLVSLADQANDAGVCWPSVRTIERRTCLSERAVQEALRWLQTTGALYREYKENSSSVYTVTPQNFDPSKAPAKRQRAGGADGAPPADSAPGADGAPGGADGAPGGADGAPHPPQQAHGGVANGAPKSKENRNRNRKGTTNEPFAPAAAATGAAGELGVQPDDLQALSKEQKTELFKALCRDTWAAYASAYQGRYGTLPVRNEKTNKNVQDIVKRVGKEAPNVATYFVQNINDAFVVRRCHAIGDLLAQCEAYRTQWAVGISMTNASAQQADKTQTNLNTAQSAADKARAMIAQREREAQEDGHAE
jgi:hypothetical protein